eukprot:COSAG01_NODE_21450_length_901_cov_2.497506_3_plen_21_part_01
MHGLSLQWGVGFYYKRGVSTT